MDIVSETDVFKAGSPEGIWDRLAHGLSGDRPDQFIQSLRDTGELKEILPEVDALFGVPQVPEHHPEIDTGVHTLMTLRKAAELSDDVSVRYAALVHDVGKGLTDPQAWPKHHDHEELGVPPVRDIAERLNIPEETAALAEHVARYHLHAHRSFEMKPGKILKLLEETEALDRPDMFEHFVLAVQADAQGRLGMENKPYPQADLLRQTLQAIQAVDVTDLSSDEMVRQVRIQAVKDVKDHSDMNLDQ